MLILGRREGERIRIGDDVTITILSLHRGKVRIGIDAPEEVDVVRTELLDDDGRPKGRKGGAS